MSNDFDNNSRMRLTVLGITRSQVQSGAYALLLDVDDCQRRIPIVVGVAEAQSIAFWLEHVQSPRPLTHDLMVSMMHAFQIGITEVEIYRFSEGVYYSHVSMAAADGTEVQLDSRTSDAIALALRTGAPSMPHARWWNSRPSSPTRPTLPPTCASTPCASGLAAPWPKSAMRTRPPYRSKSMNVSAT